MNTKRYYSVSFQWDDVVFCTNIVHAEDIETVDKEYSKYKWHHIRDVLDGELEAAKRKGMPIVEL